jgi:hypothetical protein
MKKYKFKEYKLPPADKLWLKEILKSNFDGMDESQVRVKLKNRLPRDFNPDDIDRRYKKDNHLTLLGIWYVDKDNHFIPKVSTVIKTIQKIISNNSYTRKFNSETIAKLTGYKEEEIKIAFLICHDLELFSSWGSHPGELYPCEVSFIEKHPSFNKVLYFKNIYDTIEEYFIKNEPLEGSFKSLFIRSKTEKENIYKHKVYVDPMRIEELEKINNESYDLTRLIELCRELNIVWSTDSYLATAMITRTIINHIPPIFSCKNFTELTNNYNGGKSFKDLMFRLDESLRKIADNHLHKQITSSEVLPNFTQVNFIPEVDVLLSEIISTLRKGKQL